MILPRELAAWSLASRRKSSTVFVRLQECACGCAGVFSAPVALEAYAMAFESAGALDKLEGFASHHGPDFYGLPRNQGTITLSRQEHQVTSACSIDATASSASLKVIPLFAGQTIPWQLTSS